MSGLIFKNRIGKPFPSKMDPTIFGSFYYADSGINNSPSVIDSPIVYDETGAIDGLIPADKWSPDGELKITVVASVTDLGNNPGSLEFCAALTFDAYQSGIASAFKPMPAQGSGNTNTARLTVLMPNDLSSTSWERVIALISTRNSSGGADKKWNLEVFGNYRI